MKDMARHEYKAFVHGVEYLVEDHGDYITIRGDGGGKILDVHRDTAAELVTILEYMGLTLKNNDLSIEEVERMEGEELTIIMNYPCRFHSMYKGWEIYRAWDIANDHGKMLYFASGITPKCGHTILQAGNLSGIKKRVSEVA